MTNLNKILNDMNLINDLFEQKMINSDLLLSKENFNWYSFKIKLFSNSVF